MRRQAGQVLIGEVHGLTRDNTQVITVQHWCPGTLVTFRNGQQVRVERSTRAAIGRRLAEARAALAATELTGEQARAKLRELTGEDSDTCPNPACGDQLPIGGYRCAWCGASPRRYAAGSTSGANRRPPIVFRIR